MPMLISSNYFKLEKLGKRKINATATLRNALTTGVEFLVSDFQNFSFDQSLPFTSHIRKHSIPGISEQQNNSNKFTPEHIFYLIKIALCYYSK